MTYITISNGSRRCVDSWRPCCDGGACAKWPLSTTVSKTHEGAALHLARAQKFICVGFPCPIVTYITIYNGSRCCIHWWMHCRDGGACAKWPFSAFVCLANGSSAGRSLLSRINCYAHRTQSNYIDTASIFAECEGPILRIHEVICDADRGRQHNCPATTRTVMMFSRHRENHYTCRNP